MYVRTRTRALALVVLTAVAVIDETALLTEHARQASEDELQFGPLLCK